MTDFVYHDKNDPFRDLKKKDTKKKIYQVVIRFMAAQAQTNQLQKITYTSEIIQKCGEVL